MQDIIRYAVDADGIATLTIDYPGKTMNVIDGDFMNSLSSCIDRVVADANVKVDSVFGPMFNPAPAPGKTLPKGMEVQMLDLDWVNRHPTRPGVPNHIGYVSGELFGAGGMTAGTAEAATTGAGVTTIVAAEVPMQTCIRWSEA